MADLTPEEVASREFRTTFRGYDPDEVRSFLTTLSEGLAGLLAQHAELAERRATPDLEAEIETVSREVGEVLQAAREAAESMRERASAESARWRSESLAEAEVTRRAAEEDAVALRSDAWTTADQLLQQCVAEAARTREEAAAEARRIVGEAEREAHRLAAGSRRESDEILRAARMEAEQLVVRARAEHDEIIAGAQRQAEAAQERTRALEERRQELLRELDAVRSTLTEVEGELDLRRERLGLSHSPVPVSVARPPGPPAPPAAEPPAEPRPEGDVPETWEPGETVRVVRGGRHHDAGEVVRPDVAPDVRVVSAAEISRRNDPSAPPPEPSEPRDHLSLEDVPDDEPVGTMVRPEGEAHSEPVSRLGHPPAGRGSESPARADEADAEPSALGTAADERVAGDDATDDTTGDADPSDSADAPGKPPESPASTVSEPGDEDPPTGTVDADHTSPPDSASSDPVPEEPTGDEPAEDTGPEGQGPGAPGVLGGDGEQEPESPADADASGSESFEDLGTLFQRLRTEDDGAGAEASSRRRGPAGAVDAFELRDRLLLPVGNRALRNLKRQLTDEQNVVLEEIRLDERGWEPNASSLQERVRADLVVLHAESFGAGHTAALEMLGTRTARPATPRPDLATPFAAALGEELSVAVAEGRLAGQGARQLGASLSRVFRAWRTDQAERRVREIALSAYHDGVARTAELAGVEITWMAGGRRCATCRGRSEEPVTELPPAHAGCECTVVA